MTHEFDGKKYEKASAHQKEWGTKLIAELDLRGTERILDLGCGDGALSAQIADLVPSGEVVGIDASRGMIEAARSKVRKNLRFVLLDINELNYVEQFDLVFSNATLHWVKHASNRVLNRFGGGGPRHAANPGLTPSFRRSLPETGCLSQGLPHAKR
jgi:trans-aconitate methyltransferase